MSLRSAVFRFTVRAADRERFEAGWSGPAARPRRAAARGRAASQWAATAAQLSLKNPLPTLRSGPPGPRSVAGR
ncbi:hypothetical protein GCM10009802_50970 [Streptomyces synnematoformans]|uniref:Uncharacterized protein n=1 Tax=Streptomyces synnematoformans TaxID=415721 RepID=A0ABN2ZDN7_9ACTN